MQRFERYSGYKDSGVDWIGEIPAGWSVNKIKYLFKEINEKSCDGYEDLLSVSQYTGVTKKADKNEELLTTASTLEGYKKVYVDDLVSNIMLAWNGSLGFSPFNGITSPAYSVYRLITDDNNKFFHYLFRTDCYKAEFKRNSSGVIESRLRLYTDDFFQILAILPPLPEQTAIANFLDEKITKIDTAIAQKEQMIALLKERKQILIQNAVTKGIDPDAQMKDSGVDWIGEIPEGWEMKRGKFLFTEVDERSVDGQEELLSVSHMTGVTPRSEKKVSMFMAEDYTGSKTCIAGDLIYNIMWAWMGALGVANQAGIVSPSYGVYRRKDNHTLNTNFIELLLKSTQYVAYYNKVSTGLHSSRLRFYSHMFFNMEIVFPSLAEQEDIIQYIEIEAAKINTSITLQQQQITKLKEYKSILIDHAVTGKIKVA